MFYVHCYVCRGNTKCDEMKSSRRQPMKTEERQKKRKKEKEKSLRWGLVVLGENILHYMAGASRRGVGC